jgi:nucleotide-binding universal stress UspA family protein
VTWRHSRSDHALDLAARHGATVHILTVADTSQYGPPEIRGDDIDLIEQEGHQIVREAAEQADRRGVDTVTDVVRGEPYREIVDYAERRGLDLVVMPTHGRRGLERFLLGSTSERVVRRADVPVLTMRPDDDVTISHPYQNVLVPTDGSTCANQALAIGVDVANAEDATLHLLSVIAITALGADARPDIRLAMLEETANDLLPDAAACAAAAGDAPAATTIEYGPSIHQPILAYIDDHDIDLVAVGTHGRTGFDRYVLGSVTEYLVRTSPMPVLTVRSPDPE